MSYLEVGISEILPIVVINDQIALSQVKVYVTGEIDGKNTAFYANDAFFVPVNFQTPLQQKPLSAWIGNFEGGDFAEIAWSIGNLTQEGFLLFANNQDFSKRYPRGENGLALTINIFLAFAPASNLNPKEKTTTETIKTKEENIVEKPKAPTKPKASAKTTPPTETKTALEAKPKPKR